MKKSIGVTFISYFYLFGAAVLIIVARFFYREANEFRIADRFGLQIFPEQLFRIIVAIVIVSLFAIYGYMRLKRWGFSFIIIYSVGLGLVSYFLLLSYIHQLFTGILIWSLIVIIYFSILKRVYKNIHET